MKISMLQLKSIARAMLGKGKRLASATLSVERLRAAVETGHEATNGQSFDTPKQAVLEAVVSETILEYADQLVVAGSKAVVLNETIRTVTRKGTDSVDVHRTQRSNLGEARPAVAGIHRLRTYIASITRQGAAAVSPKTRKALVREFNSLPAKSFALLNVGDDKAGFGLVRAKAIIGNMAVAESEAVDSFTKRQLALGIATGKADATRKSTR